MAAPDLSGRVVLVTATPSGAGRPVAAIPTPTPGLYVHWDPSRRSYVIAAACGLVVACGWNRPDSAWCAADDLNGLADWATVTRETAGYLAYRTVARVGRIVEGWGGMLIARLPGTCTCFGGDADG
ncbi:MULTISPECIES: Rossmann-fold NAD(P)-binding domain-containing protein [Streptomycetaceae]|nr:MULTISPECIES: hypothetical protein [Streptomycetaceae]MYS59283.1 hypothetical protein [Streptomyces sp. SID5468]CCB75002.1 protein of unknown function [Streptantibioticus cattleyicolor NRRL 8057 = DSM 46488]